MSTLSPKYPILDPLPQVNHHDHLPEGFKELSRIHSNHNQKLYVFISQGTHLTILAAFHAGPENQYFCEQYDFPLKALTWFPNPDISLKEGGGTV